MNKALKIALVAGEASGDILGADLMQALRQIHSKCKFIGVGGELMTKSGLNSIFPMERLSVMGISEVLWRIPELLWRRRKLSQTLIAAKPDVFIGIDAPDFNLDLELKLRQNDIKTVHLVSPSIWAWRQKRVLKIKKACDLMLTLLPFEAKFYRDAQVPVVFVGHPLADKINPFLKDKAKILLNIKEEQSVIALMPGSRASEVGKLGDLFLQSAQVLQEQGDFIFMMPAANQKRLAQMQKIAAKYPKLKLHIIEAADMAKLALNAADLVIVASGTATLEAMLYQTPMVVAYKLSDFTYWLFKKMIKTKFISLPNLLADAEIVPELIQAGAKVENIVQNAQQILAQAQTQITHFEHLKNMIKQDSSYKAAQAILDLCIQKQS